LDIQETRRCNIYNLKAVARYYGFEEMPLLSFYEELQKDERFLYEANERIVAASSEAGFKKGLFSKGPVDSIDWFAFQRVLLYVLVRHLGPQWCLETGVYYGGNSAFILNALNKNGSGTLVSIDLPDRKIRQLATENGGRLDLRRHPAVGDSELYDETLSPGFMIPDYLRSCWRFIEESSLSVIPRLDSTFDFYIHDSDHSFDFMSKELMLVRAKMNGTGTMVVDDINWSNAFFKFCVEGPYHPLCLTDNGKDNLNVRTGLVLLNHPNNIIPAITGAGVG